MLTDTTLIIYNPAEQSKCYAYYENSDGVTSKHYFYISWDLTEENLDAYIEPDLFNTDFRSNYQRHNSTPNNNRINFC
jgi:hypothetical protein